MAESTWLEWFEETSEAVSEMVWGPSPKEVLRRSAREVKRSLNQVNRERTIYEQRESVLKNEIRKRAQVATDPRDLAPLAKEIARVRGGIRRSYKMGSSLEGTYQRLLGASTTATIQNALQEATLAMAAAGGVSNPVSLAATMRNYAMQQEKFTMAGDMLEDIVDDDEEETEDVNTLLGQLSEELSIKLKFELPSVSERERDARVVDDFSARLAMLR